MPWPTEAFSPVTNKDGPPSMQPLLLTAIRSYTQCATRQQSIIGTDARAGLDCCNAEFEAMNHHRAVVRCSVIHGLLMVLSCGWLAVILCGWTFQALRARRHVGEHKALEDS